MRPLYRPGRRRRHRPIAPHFFSQAFQVHTDPTDSGTLNPGDGTFPADAAPAITSAASYSFVHGTSPNFTVTATGYPAPTFSDSGSLDGLTLNATTGVLSGTPTTTGTFTSTITASNGVTPAATQSFSLTVNSGVAPAITSASSTTFSTGTAGTFTVTATGTPAPTFTETGNLPGGVTLNSTTGVLSGTPGAGTAGTYSISITAANGTLPNSTQSFTLTVTSGANTIITCPEAGTVAFASPGLSFGGALSSATSAKTAATITPTGTGCSGLPIKVSIASATTLCPETGGVPNGSDPSACLASKTKDNVTTYSIASKPYYYDTTGSYETNGVTDLQAALAAKPLKTTIDNIGVVLDYGTATQITPGGVCGATDVGFYLTGNVQVKSLNVATYTDTVCISGDAGTGTTGDFFNDLGSPLTTITSATVGDASALTVTFPNQDCPEAGTVAFASPGLSFGGALSSATSAKTAATITPTGTGCSGLPIKVSIASATTLCPETGGVPNGADPSACLASKTKDNVTTYSIASKPYYYDTTGSYETNGVTDLQAALAAKPLKTTIDNIGVVLDYGTATQITPGGVCGATDVGFYLTGNVQVKSLNVATYTDTVCISGDAGTGTTGDFFNDLGSPLTTITSATVGDASALTVNWG